MYMDSLEQRKIQRNLEKTLVAALYEAKVKDDEIIRLLKKYCGIDDEGAINVLKREKFIDAPCRELYQYLLLEKGLDSHEADVFIHNKAKAALAGNPELSKLSSAKMYDAIQ